jgi:endonuclease YncB( thermonuclease family)
MKALVVANPSYSRLLSHIKQEIAGALTRAHLAFEHEKIIAYWRIGESIALHLAANKDQAGYGTQLYKNLSHDLGIGERLLYQVTQFYNTYPDFTPLQHLKWSHYRLLTTVKDGKQRTILEAKAAHDHWSKRALEIFLKADKDKNPNPPKPPKPKPLPLLKGRLYTYSIFKAKYADNLMVDCGFNIYHESELTKFSGNIVETVKTQNGFDFVKSNATLQQLYTYKAYVEKIVDADTIWIMVDCGFKVWSRQKIRLRGINAPEITTPKGIEAFKFVSSTLKTLPFVVVKSHGRDKYDRYLMDIFYLSGESDPQVVLEKGNFLNQQLLDKGLAVRED